MKRTIVTIALLIGVTIVSCNTKSEEKIPEAVIPASVATDVPYTEARNYFVKNSFREAQLSNPKISSQEKFEAIFGMARTMAKDGIPTPIDFSKQYVIAIINPVTDITTTLSVSTLKQKDNAIILNYDVEEGKKQSFSTQPFLLLVVDTTYQGEIITERNM
ncbi:hypothetical protein [Flavobacterium humi]|uniref:Uncharacterized protein n=1 Tax=Flavobacterium humi TaxID=2562683 RepID=A0A4Z0L656_9FLAO|nr:hypothetical protein [Flavobacterium humi]TGD57996.1 hypothetical protein E4635_08280 [Flavobacterium humi]